MPPSCAIDFGTSNTTVMLVEEGRVSPLAIDPDHHNPYITPTLMYFRPGHAPCYGAKAIQSYLENDLEGRLIQSIKRHLPAEGFEGTAVGRSTLSLEGLIGGFLRHVKARVDAAAGQPVQRVLLGRPARFHREPARDRLAERRLEAAAQMAGFTEIRFQAEPIAAARAFERALDHDVTCLVGDLGGGTSDFTVIQLGPSRVGGDRLADVRGVSGVDIAGNDFDAKLVWTRVVPHFGVNAQYRPDRRWVEVPTVLHHAMTRWHTLCQSNTPKNLEFLQRMIRTADDKPGLGRLLELIEDNYGYLLFQSVEACKIGLSSHEQAPLSFHRGSIHIEEQVSAAGFEDATRAELSGLSAEIDALFTEIGRTDRDIDVVFLTGGSSKLRGVQRLFHDRFPGRIVEQDAFLSVGVGLGVEAAELFS